jgi:RNA polymerase sigma-70 factor (ECF subfamily)
VSQDQSPDSVSADRAADELLVVRCQLGESDAFDALIGRWHQPLWSYIRRMAGRDADAQDLAQEVWIRVIRGIPRLRDGSRLRGWLFGIARRVLMDRLRRAYATPSTAEVEVDTLPAEATASMELEADLALLDDTLTALPVTEREVLTLFYLRDLSLAELAEAVGVPIGTVKSRLFRARRMLRAAMQERGAS